MLFDAVIHRGPLRDALGRAGIDVSTPEGKGRATTIRDGLKGMEIDQGLDETGWDQMVSKIQMRIAEKKEPPPPRGWVGCLYGPPKTGKSTLAMAAPHAIACDIEDGLGWIDGEKRNCESWPEFMRMLEMFPKSEYQTLVVDTADVLEKRLWEYLCAKNKWAGIESPGFGKGYAEALENWINCLTLIRRISKDNKKNFIFTAHSQVKTILNPDGESFDRNNIALHSKVSDYFFAQMDFVGFCHFDSRVRKNAGGDFVASTNGARLVSMGGDTLASQVGNRFGIVGKVPMDSSFYKLLGRRN